ncbi:hypothetical protein C8R45DRAFT_1214566 [Mycena sanguinolenta]|nr:hypothetical protein C8R45DRAFT_1214566 [Mycena sanguinolenta]
MVDALNYRSRGEKLPYHISPSCDPLFTSNVPPAANQLIEIAESVRIAHTLKSDLDLQITETRMKLLRLEREEMHAARHIERCRFPLAPIRRIPNEILSMIFVCYADSLKSIAPRRGINWHHEVLVLGHICSHWRAVLLSTHALWAAFSHRCGVKVRNPTAVAEEFLLRAGTHPLSIEFRCLGMCGTENSNYPHSEAVCRDIFDSLLTRCSQWKAAKIEIHPPLYPELRVVKNNIPNLAKLYLSLFNVTGHTLHDLETFQSCPRLVDLNLQSYSLWDELIEYIAFPWDQLERYSGAASYGAGAVDVLAQAPNIVDCAVYYRADHPLGDLVVHQMRNLRLLAGAHPEFLESLELPALEHLAYRADMTSAVAHLLRRSAPPLESIKAHGFGTSSVFAGILYVLGAAPALTRLEIRGSPDDQAVDNASSASSVFDQLALTPFVVPKLKHLVLTSVAFDATFVRMIEARCVGDSTSRLESLRVAAIGDTEHVHLFRLRRLELQHGLRLTIEVDTPSSEPVFERFSLPHTH